MKHLGNITEINGAEIPVVDVITGGSPCQDLSIAGKRAGLDGERSGLFIEQIRVIKEMRENDRRTNRRTGFMVRPRYMVWENVPGAFTSPGKGHNGEDFRAVLTEIVRIAEPGAPDVPLPEKGKWRHAGVLYDEMGGWSIAWRLHDAQYWGVPQRRKRIALVADFGGLSAPEVLFEREGMPRDPEQSEQERKENTGGAGESTERADSFQERAGKPGGGKGILIQEDRTGALSTVNNQAVYTFSQDAYSKYSENEHAASIKACGGTYGGGSEALVIGFNREQCGVAYRKKGHPASAEDGQGWQETERADTLNTYDQSETRTPILVCENHSQDTRYKVLGDICQTVSATFGMGGNNQPLIVSAKQLQVYDASRRHSYQPFSDGVCETIQAAYGEGGNNQPIVLESNQNHATITDNGVATTLPASMGEGGGYIPMIKERQNMIVRRLTPLECERLQGFPDGWTDIGEWTDSKGKRHKPADGPRYKALGNSIATPFWFFLLRRIAAEYERPATLGSLFDGIAGFPYCWARCNGSGSCLWSSEIEEFPIAVIKKHFGDEDTGEAGDIRGYL